MCLNVFLLFVCFFDMRRCSHEVNCFFIYIYLYLVQMKEPLNPPGPEKSMLGNVSHWICNGLFMCKKHKCPKEVQSFHVFSSLLLSHPSRSLFSLWLLQRGIWHDSPLSVMANHSHMHTVQLLKILLVWVNRLTNSHTRAT